MSGGYSTSLNIVYLCGNVLFIFSNLECLSLLSSSVSDTVENETVDLYLFWIVFSLVTVSLTADTL